jgi:DNA-binding transcriptional regulator YhcF (GntR family)
MDLDIERDGANGRGSEPVYRQIAAQIREQIQSGDLGEGDRASSPRSST